MKIEYEKRRRRLRAPGFRCAYPGYESGICILDECARYILGVMAGLVPAIYVLLYRWKTWMPAT